MVIASILNFRSRYGESWTNVVLNRARIKHVKMNLNKCFCLPLELLSIVLPYARELRVTRYCNVHSHRSSYMPALVTMVCLIYSHVDSSPAVGLPTPMHVTPSFDIRNFKFMIVFCHANFSH